MPGARLAGATHRQNNKETNVQTWAQTYDPLGNLWLSSLVAAIPIIFFFIALAVLRMKGHIAGEAEYMGKFRR